MITNQRPRLARQLISFYLVLVLLAFVWEAVKWIGGDPWFPDANPFGIAHTPPLRFKVASDLNLPHLWDIVEASPHRWRSLVRGNDILIWDNLGTVHDRPPFSSRESREVWFGNLGPVVPQPAFAA